MLRTASILTPRTPEDGLRISVMSRHTLEDGKTPDDRIMAGVSYDEHWQGLAPPAKLVGAYYRGELDFPTYETKYREHLWSDAVIGRVNQLVDLALTQDVTILCIEDTPEHCHRRILAEVCQEVNGTLDLSIR